MNNSLKAYFDPDNIRKWKSHKGLILHALRYAKYPLTRWEISQQINLNDHAVQKRLSDLKNEWLIEECGTITYNGNDCSLYRIKEQLQLFSLPEKLTLKKWLQNNYPKIYTEYENTNKNTR